MQSMATLAPAASGSSLAFKDSVRNADAAVHFDGQFAVSATPRRKAGVKCVGSVATESKTGVALVRIGTRGRSVRLFGLSWSTSHWIFPGLLVRAAAASSDAFPGRGDGSSSSGEQREADELAAKFMQFVSETQQDWPSTERRPTALLPPTAVVKTLMDSLMRNDWPDTDSGLQTAFNFSMPQDANDMLPGAALVTAVRAWDAAERYLKHRDFEQLLKEPIYAPLFNCNAWEFHSPMTFHRPADSSALQAVRVRFNRPDSSEERELTYTFILERVSTGPFKGCWMVVGLRVGDYANV